MAGNSKKVIFAALIGNGLIAVTKFIAASITGSSAMLSEGIHSLVDTGNQVLLLYGIKRSKQPPSARFPFGHGKEIYFWSFTVAILIFAVGSGISIYEGIHHILHPVPLTKVYINYIVLGLAIIFEAAAFFIALTEFNKSRGDFGIFEAVRRGKDPTMFVVLFEDSAALLGLFVALIAIAMVQWTGILWLDGAASVVIGLILGITAILLAIETKSLLIGEAANLHVIEGVKQILAKDPAIGHVNEVLTMHMGPDFILLNISVEFPDSADATTIEESIVSIDQAIKAKYPTIKKVFVEAEARVSNTSASSV